MYAQGWCFCFAHLSIYLEFYGRDKTLIALFITIHTAHINITIDMIPMHTIRKEEKLQYTHSILRKSLELKMIEVHHVRCVGATMKVEK